jgi:uncharacterized protein (TIGR00251 family)
LRIRVSVLPNSRKDEVTVREDGSLSVKVKAPPREGRANEAVTRAVAAYLGLSRNEVRLVAGHKSRTKTLEVPDRAV